MDVQYAHCEDLAEGCGLQPPQVTEALRIDNLGKLNNSTELNQGGMALDSDGLNLDFDSEEEIDFEEGLE